MVVSTERPVIGPTPTPLEILTNGVFTPKKDLTKQPSGARISTRLVSEGSGMAGLEDPAENKEWAGMFNHYAKTAGASFEIGRLLKLNGHEVDVQMLVDTVMVSHNGRRQFDEASWYPQEVADSAKKKEKGDAVLSNETVLTSGAPVELANMVAVHGLGRTFPFEATKTWNQKLPMYLDFRISQNAMPLDQRMTDLQRGVPERYSQDFLDQTKAWAQVRERELFEALNLPSYQAVATNPDNLRARIRTAIKLGKFDKKQADALKGLSLFRRKTGKNIAPEAAVGMSQEEFLERLQLKPEDINDTLIQPQSWERYIRRLYVQDAESGIFENIRKMKADLAVGKITQEDFDREFPPSSWWGNYVKEVYEKQKGIVKQPRKGKPNGFKRATEFYKKIDKRRAQVK